MKDIQAIIALTVFFLSLLAIVRVIYLALKITSIRSPDELVNKQAEIRQLKAKELLWQRLSGIGLATFIFVLVLPEKDISSLKLVGPTTLYIFCIAAVFFHFRSRS